MTANRKCELRLSYRGTNNVVCCESIVNSSLKGTQATKFGTYYRAIIVNYDASYFFLRQCDVLSLYSCVVMLTEPLRRTIYIVEMHMVYM